MTAQGILHLGMHGEYNVYLQGNYLFLTSIIKENKLLICVQGTGEGDLAYFINIVHVQCAVL